MRERPVDKMRTAFSHVAGLPRDSPSNSTRAGARLLLEVRSPIEGLARAVAIERFVLAHRRLVETRRKTEENRRRVRSRSGQDEQETLFSPSSLTEFFLAT